MLGYVCHQGTACLCSVYHACAKIATPGIIDIAEDSVGLILATCGVLYIRHAVSDRVFCFFSTCTVQPQLVAALTLHWCAACKHCASAITFICHTFICHMQQVPVLQNAWMACCCGVQPAQVSSYSVEFCNVCPGRWFRIWTWCNACIHGVGVG